MRILLYNFVQPDQPGAGGVGSYHSGLAHALADGGHEVVAMSSGVVYSALGWKRRLRFRQEKFRKVLIVNSPVLAPARFSFTSPDAFNASPELDFVPAELRRKLGAIQVFHFQNLEGLTRSFFVELRRVFPEAKILYSAHNYNLVCPVVTLWSQDRPSCEDYRGGGSCTVCRATIHSRRRSAPDEGLPQRAIPSRSDGRRPEVRRPASIAAGASRAARGCGLRGGRNRNRPLPGPRARRHTPGSVLSGVNLGLVPPLWEDNLPQVAIELVSRGIPILTSDRGGAQEVFANKAFTFPAGSHRELIDRLVAIEAGRIRLGSFWEGPVRLFSMSEHVTHLERHYSGRAGHVK